MNKDWQNTVGIFFTYFCMVAVANLIAWWLHVDLAAALLMEMLWFVVQMWWHQVASK